MSFEEDNYNAPNQDASKCAHELELLQLLDALVYAQAVLEVGKEKDKTPEEKLGILSNIVCGCIYHGAKTVGIERFYVPIEDGKVIEITPTQEEIPDKLN